MKKIKSFGEVLNDLTRFSFGEKISLLDSVEQLSSFHLFEDQEKSANTQKKGTRYKQT